MCFGTFFLKFTKIFNSRTPEDSGQYIQKCVHMARTGQIGAPAWSTSGIVTNLQNPEKKSKIQIC